MQTNIANLNNNKLFVNTAPVSNAGGIYGLLSLGYGVKNAPANASGAGTMNAAAKSFVTEAKKQSENLKLSMISLMGSIKTSSVFTQKTAVSSDVNALSIKAFNPINKNFEDMAVQIKRTAAAQINTGFQLNAAGKDFTAGYHQFQIETDNKKTQVSFTVNPKDDNKTVLQKMADAINGRSAGVTASVSYDPVKKTGALVVESLTTGWSQPNTNSLHLVAARPSVPGTDNNKPKFNITDVSGNAISVSGADTVSQDARNAVYSVNGGDWAESESNTADIGNGVTVIFKSASEQNVTVSYLNDKTASINKTREMVNAFNGLLAAADGINAKSNKNLANELRSVMNAYTRQLNDAGISANKDGYMQIDEKKMDRAADSGTLARLFTGDGANANYGFAYRVMRIADKINQNPAGYLPNDMAVNNPNRNNAPGGRYGAELSFSQILKMDRLSSIGMLFDLFA